MRHLENEVKGLHPPSVPGFSSELQPCIQAEAPCRVQGKLVFACVPRASLLRATCTSNIDLHDTDAKLTQPVLPKMPGSWKTGATGDPEQGRQAGGGMAQVNCHRPL